MNYCFALIFMCVMMGCTTLGVSQSNTNADQTGQVFFEDLQRSHREQAYGLFAKGLSNVVAFDQFNGLLDAVQQQWGRIQSAQTVEMPFHKRAGESNFIPLDVKDTQIKRYVYEVQFDNALVNWDVTLAMQDGQYKIIWLSLWGSNNYFTSEIREKIEGLFGQGQ